MHNERRLIVSLLCEIKSNIYSTKIYWKTFFIWPHTVIKHKEIYRLGRVQQTLSKHRSNIVLGWLKTISIYSLLYWFLSKIYFKEIFILGFKIKYYDIMYKTILNLIRICHHVVMVRHTVQNDQLFNNVVGSN